MTAQGLAAHPDYDYLIVGGGSAGAALAARLAEGSEASVLLLEAGRDVRTLEDLPERLRTHSASGGGVARPGAGIDDGGLIWIYDVQLVTGTSELSRQVRGRALGGSSSMNGANFHRGLPEDYDSWGFPEWAFESVLPYFRKLERDLDFDGPFHGRQGPVPIWRVPRAGLDEWNSAVYEAALLAGYREKPDLNHPDGDGMGLTPRNDLGGSRMTTAVAYLAPARRRANLTIQAATSVERVIFEGHRAVGVEALADGRSETYRAAEIILCAGAFESPMLLMRSGIGNAETLEALGIKVVQPLSGVGANLQCQPSVNLRVSTERDISGVSDSPVTSLITATRSARHRNEMGITPRRIGAQLFLQCQLRLPESVGGITPEIGPDGLRPRIAYGYLADYDAERLREAYMTCRELVASPPLRAFGAQEIDAQDDLSRDELLRRLHTPFHACGTCKLGPPSDPEAVVDAECRVHGVDGLRVADVSIMPASVRAGPAATAVMIGERVAGLLVGEIERGARPAA